MSLSGIVLTDLLCLLFAAGIWRLLRRNRLYLEFALLWFSVTALVVVVVSVPGLLEVLDAVKSRFFGSSLYVVSSLFFILGFLIWITVILSGLRSQVTEVVRELALLRSRTNE